MALTYDVTTTSNSASVTIYGLNTTYPAKEFEMHLYHAGSGEIFDTVSVNTYDSSYTCTYTGLDPETEYGFVIIVRTYDVSDLLTTESVPSGGTGRFVTGSSGGGDGDDEDISFTIEYGSTDIVFSVTSAAGYYLRYYIRYPYPDGRTVYDTDDTSEGRSMSLRDTVTKSLPGILDPDTTYVCNVGYSDTAAGNVTWIVSGGVEFTTESGGGGSLTLFDWNASNGSASAAQTRAAYAAVTNHGNVSDFSYLVWNDIVDKIMDWIDTHSGWRWETDRSDGPLTYNETKMTASDRTMTADRLNSAVHNLRDGIGGTIPSSWQTVSPGDPCLGSYFTDLVDYLNLAIETK